MLYDAGSGKTSVATSMMSIDVPEIEADDDGKVYENEIKPDNDNCTIQRIWMSRYGQLSV